MLKIENQAYFDEVKEFATKHELMPKLQEQLDYLGRYACPEDDNQRTVCYLYADFAPFSFSFTMNIRKKDGSYERFMNGGLIYFGPSEGGVGAPQYSVSLRSSEEARWEIHT